MYVKIVQDHSCIGIHDTVLAGNDNTKNVLIMQYDGDTMITLEHHCIDHVYTAWRTRNLRRPWVEVTRPLTN